MDLPVDNFYAIWRQHRRAVTLLRDYGSVPSEKLLQSIWQHQRFRRDRLQTTDGKPVRIFHPGFISVEGGPDFANAVLQIGDEPPRSGDVEVDLRSAGWRAHGHDRNPAFQNVILHVVWEGSDVPANPLPTLLLKNFLATPLVDLNMSLENEPLRTLPENLRGKCCSPLRELDEAKLAEILRQAARVRLESRADQFRIRAKAFGWEQALWEQLFRALGYKHNVWAMQHLAEMKSRWALGAGSVFEFQVRLLGVSGLLPDELTRSQKSADNHLRRTWDAWWRERDGFRDCVMPRAAWKFHGLRPANHPQRRLALAAHWLADQKLVTKIEDWCAKEILDGRAALPRSPDSVLASLREILEVDDDDFWSWHWTFRSERMKKPLPLLGDARVTDLAVNVILPWLWVRAVEGENEKIRSLIEHRYFAWPAAEDNSVLKLARQRLLGVGKTRVLRTASAQQGLMQIVRDFCDHSNAVCDDCRFPELVRGFSSSSTARGDDKKC